MHKSSIGLVVSVVLVLAAATSCSDSNGGGTGKGGGAGTSSSGGRGGTTGSGGGGTTGTGGGGTTGTGGGGTTGTGGGGTTGTGGGGTTGTGGGTAGTGGTTGAGGNAGRGGGGGATGGATAGTGGGTAGTGGGTAGTGGGTAGAGGGAAGAGGGAAGTGGSAGGGGGTGGGVTLPVAPLPPTTGTATRPQLTAGAAPDYTILKYLAKGGALATPTTDNWDPTAGVGDVSTFTPMFTADPASATTPTVQAALNAAIAVGGTARVYVRVMPGTYRETICIKSGPPITLYSTNADASQTVIVNNANAGKMYVDATTQPAWNTCAATNPPAAGANYGTSGSATVGIFARDFQAKNLTFANDFDETGMTSNLQAVALMTQQDKLVFENVRLLGNQDTLYVKSNNVDNVYRAYFKGCFVEGDVDYIFGRAVMVLDGCTINYTSARRGASNGGDIISPSTDARNLYGALIINSMFTADGATNAGTVSLGRAWDEGGASGATMWPATAGATNYPNGQVVIRQSTLGAHIIGAAPWQAAASTGRPYSSTATANFPANRLFEYMNTGAGAAP